MEEHERFTKLFLGLDGKTKKAVNDWCIKKHELHVPEFISEAKDAEKKELNDKMEAKDWAWFGIVDEDGISDAQYELANKETEEHAELPPLSEAMTKAPVTVGVNAMSDADLKKALAMRGYKQELVLEVRALIVDICSVRVYVPENEKNLSAYIQRVLEGSPDARGTQVGPTVECWEDADA